MVRQGPPLDQRYCSAARGSASRPRWPSSRTIHGPDARAGGADAGDVADAPDDRADVSLGAGRDDSASATYDWCAGGGPGAAGGAVAEQRVPAGGPGRTGAEATGGPVAQAGSSGRPPPIKPIGPPIMGRTRRRRKRARHVGHVGSRSVAERFCVPRGRPAIQQGIRHRGTRNLASAGATARTHVPYLRPPCCFRSSTVAASWIKQSAWNLSNTVSTERVSMRVLQSILRWVL